MKGVRYFKVNLIFLNQTMHFLIRLPTAGFNTKPMTYNVVPFLPVSPKLGTVNMTTVLQVGYLHLGWRVILISSSAKTLF